MLRNIINMLKNKPGRGRPFILIRERSAIGTLLHYSLLALAVSASLWSGSGRAAPELTGFSSDSTIPYSLFDDTEAVKPWVKPAPPKKKALQPATAESVQEKNKIQQLEKQLAELQRENNQAIAGHQTEKRALQEKLQALQLEKTNAESQIKQLDALRQKLSEAQSSHSASEQQLSELRTQLAAHQLLVDTHALQHASLTDKVTEKEQQILALNKTLEAQKGEIVALQAQAKMPDEKQLAALKQHQDKISELEGSLADAEKQKTAMQAQLAKQQAMQQSAAPESHEQKLSYANGVAFASSIVQSLRAQQNLGVVPDRPMVLSGIKDAFSQRVALNGEEVEKLVSELDDTLNQKLQAQQTTRATEREKQLKAGNALIEKTKTRKGVKTLDGAYYVVSKNGKGEKLTPESTVDILLTGRLPDGTVFDSSGRDKKVQRIKLDSLLPTLTKVLSQLKRGSEVEVILPADKAFGDEGVENLIPPGATLIFDIKINN